MSVSTLTSNIPVPIVGRFPQMRLALTPFMLSSSELVAALVIMSSDSSNVHLDSAPDVSLRIVYREMLSMLPEKVILSTSRSE